MLAASKAACGLAEALSGALGDGDGSDDGLGDTDALGDGSVDGLGDNEGSVDGLEDNDGEVEALWDARAALNDATSAASEWPFCVAALLADGLGTGDAVCEVVFDALCP